MLRYDKMEVYCRMLGNDVPFRYCRTGATGSMCRRIRDCWFERLDIDAYLSECFTCEELAGVFAEAPGKMERIITAAVKGGRPQG